MSEIGNITWNDNLERYFASTGEKAQALSILHKDSESIYSKRRTFIDLPVIVISGVTGFLSVGSTSMFNDATATSVALGLASLLVSVLNTVGTYFSWAKRAEQHRISSIQYSRLFRFLMVEMGLPRNERMTPSDLLKYTKEAYDRLQEISPLVPDEIINKNKKKFEKYDSIALPEEMNGLVKVVIQNVSIPATKSLMEIRTPAVMANDT